mgnify:FL=1
MARWYATTWHFSDQHHKGLETNRGNNRQGCALAAGCDAAPSGLSQGQDYILPARTMYEGNEMSATDEKKRLLSSMLSRESCKVLKERLGGTDAVLTSFVFRHGGNVYVFSYEKDGKRRHTFIDAGDPRYRNRMLRILTENNVAPANIERIILTHRHYDNWCLAPIL